jgi:hypothetical protein
MISNRCPLNYGDVERSVDINGRRRPCVYRTRKQYKFTSLRRVEMCFRNAFFFAIDGAAIVPDYAGGHIGWFAQASKITYQYSDLEVLVHGSRT